jgi:hypothetical protein
VATRVAIYIKTVSRVSVFLKIYYSINTSGSDLKVTRGLALLVLLVQGVKQLESRCYPVA